MKLHGPIVKHFTIAFEEQLFIAGVEHVPVVAIESLNKRRHDPH